MRFFRMVGSDFLRMVSSWKFWLSIMGVAIVALSSLLPEAEALSNASVFYLVQARGGLGVFLLAMTVLVVFPFGLCHREDLKNNYVHCLEARTSTAVRCWSHLVITAISAFLVVLLGYFLCVAVLSVKQPMILDSDLENMRMTISMNSGSTVINGYENLVLNGHILLYFMAVFTTEALGYAFLACFTLMLSAKIADSFVLLSVPILFFYISLYVADAAQLPGIFRWYYVMQQGGYFRAHIFDIRILMLSVVLYFGGLIFVEGLIYQLWTGRRRVNG